MNHIVLIMSTLLILGYCKKKDEVANQGCAESKNGIYIEGSCVSEYVTVKKSKFKIGNLEF